MVLVFHGFFILIAASQCNKMNFFLPAEFNPMRNITSEIGFPVGDMDQNISPDLLRHHMCRRYDRLPGSGLSGRRYGKQVVSFQQL